MLVVNNNLKSKKMNKYSLIIVIAALISSLSNAQERFIADKEKSVIQWLGEKVTGEHHGSIDLKEGWLTWQGDKILGGEFTIDMASIKSFENLAKLVGHLKSDDFFGVEKFPVSKLVLTGSESFSKGNAVIKGNLTIKGITHPVEFRAARQVKDDGVWFYSNIIVDRSKYNIRYGSGSFFDNLGDKTIYDEFKLKVNLLVKK
jgi:polyisoprenoid-binding protein YceI